MVEGWIRYAGTGPANVPPCPRRLRAARGANQSSAVLHAATLIRLSETSHLASNSNKIFVSSTWKLA